MEETVALIKSCIISKKGGVPIEDLNDEFQTVVGESIPYRRLGFSSLRALLQTIDGLETTWNDFGEETLRINDSKISHIDRLIRRQKVDYSKTRNKYYKQFMRNDGNLRYNNDERREKNRLIYNTNRANRRNQDLAHRRNPNLFGTNGAYKNNFLNREEENHHPVVIETNEVKKQDSIYEPVANGQQLLGDDFFLQLAIRNLHHSIWRYKGTRSHTKVFLTKFPASSVYIESHALASLYNSYIPFPLRKNSLALHCGLCISGQTISDCTRALRNISSISNRVVILLGSVDVYNNATCDEMIEDMTELLQVLRSKFHLSNTAITICTLPPLANISIYSYKKQSMALLSFNNWIRSLADDPSTRDTSFVNYPVIDLYAKFCHDETYVTNYDWFQTQARRVSGTKHSYVLWNDIGRMQAMDLICEEKSTDRSRSPSSLSMQ